MEEGVEGLIGWRGRMGRFYAGRVEEGRRNEEEGMAEGNDRVAAQELELEEADGCDL